MLAPKYVLSASGAPSLPTLDIIVNAAGDVEADRMTPRHPKDCTCWQVDNDHPSRKGIPPVQHAVRSIDNLASPSPFEHHPDDVAVDRFAAVMKAKLAKKRGEGLGGWDDPEQCHIDYLVSLLMQQIHERSVLDPIDIANLSMMIHERGETPSHGR